MCWVMSPAAVYLTLPALKSPRDLAWQARVVFAKFWQPSICEVSKILNRIWSSKFLIQCILKRAS
jgi:hypothetical protein